MRGRAQVTLCASSKEKAPLALFALFHFVGRGGRISGVGRAPLHPLCCSAGAPHEHHTTLLTSDFRRPMVLQFQEKGRMEGFWSDYFLFFIFLDKARGVAASNSPSPTPVGRQACACSGGHCLSCCTRGQGIETNSGAPVLRQPRCRCRCVCRVSVGEH